jgi:hypothetical protein
MQKSVSKTRCDWNMFGSVWIAFGIDWTLFGLDWIAFGIVWMSLDENRIAVTSAVRQICSKHSVCDVRLKS